MNAKTSRVNEFEVKEKSFCLKLLSDKLKAKKRETKMGATNG